MTPSTKPDTVFVVRWTDPRFPASNGIRKICLDKAKAEAHAYEMAESDKALRFTVEPWKLD